jgi:DNA sulfur modification protein DndB
MADYILDNQSSYVFSAITASIDSEVVFEPHSDDPTGRHIGKLRVPMTAKFVINDGQHRRAAIERALKEAPELGDETIAVVFFLDLGLERCQQMFTDLNRYAIRPSASLGILYDHRDISSLVVKEIIRKARIFRGMVELEKSTLAPRSGKLFTLSALMRASKHLLADHAEEDIETQATLGAQFWDSVAVHIPEWTMVRDRKLSAGEVRRDYICGHAVVLAALGHAGRALMKAKPKLWQTDLPKLRQLNWSRSNHKMWEGRATIGGKVSKSRNNVMMTTSALKSALGLPLSPNEIRLEQNLAASEPGRD